MLEIKLLSEEGQALFLKTLKEKKVDYKFEIGQNIMTIKENDHILGFLRLGLMATAVLIEDYYIFEKEGKEELLDGLIKSAMNLFDIKGFRFLFIEADELIGRVAEKIGFSKEGILMDIFESTFKKDNEKIIALNLKQFYLKSSGCTSCSSCDGNCGAE